MRSISAGDQGMQGEHDIMRQTPAGISLNGICPLNGVQSCNFVSCIAQETSELAVPGWMQKTLLTHVV
jgi:hypothetical protein